MAIDIQKGSCLKKLCVAAVLYAAVSAGYCRQAPAETAVPLGLDDALRRAVNTSEDVTISDNNIERMTHTYMEIKSGLYPDISAAAWWQKNIQYPGHSSTDDYEMNTGISVTQLLWSFGRVFSAVNAAEESIAISRVVREKSLREVVYDAAVAYYAAVLAHHTYVIAETSYANARETQKLVEEQCGAGRAHRRDLIKARADAASREPRMREARTQMYAAEKTVCQITGISGGQKLILTDDFPVHYDALDVTALKKTLLDTHPEIVALRKKVSVDENLIRVNAADYFPSISAYGSWDYSGSGGHYAADKLAFDHSTSAGLKIEVPLWTGGEITAKLRKSIIDKNNDVLRLSQKKDELMLELDTALIRYHELLDILEANKEAVRLARESFRMTKELYGSGMATLTDLNDAELLLTNGRIQEQLTLYRLAVSRALIKKLTEGERGNE